jgi:flagellar FliJ protein
MTQSLGTVLQHAEKERDQAQAALRRAEEHARRAQAQAEQLQGYRADYQRRWTQQFSRQGTMDIVQCYQSFTQRLDEALTQQTTLATHAGATVERLRQALLAAETRVASVRKLIERRQAEQRLAHDRREQRQTDETAQQIRWRQVQAAQAEHAARADLAESAPH